MGRNLLELVLSQAATGLRRHSLATVGAVANIAVSLTILGAFFVATTNLQYLAQGLATEATIICQLDDKVDVAEVEAKLYGDTRVRDTRFVSREEALEDYARRVNLPYKDLKGALNNPLPDTIHVTVVDPEDLREVAAAAGKIEGIKKVRYRADVAEKLLRVARAVQTMGLVLGGLMALAALLLVGTTIHLAIHARRREIRIMQLVGATNNFIRAPFLVEGCVEGLLGGVAAAVMLVAGYSYLYNQISENLAFVELIYSSQFVILVALGTVLSGLLLGIIGSLVGTWRYLRLV
jgi:cell division transport system permease protein